MAKSSKGASSKRSDGILIGFNFEGFIFVIVDVVPLDKEMNLD